MRKDYDGYNAMSQKQNNLASTAFSQPERPQTAQVGGRQRTIENCPAEYTISGRETKATKQAMLASNNPLTGASSLTAYNRVRATDEVKVIDL